jgi:hypothetical protein
MIEIPSNKFYGGKNSNYVPKSRGALNDTMNDYIEMKMQKNKPLKREIYYQRKSNDSFDDYFLQNDKSICVKSNSDNFNSELDSFYLYYSEDNQNKNKGKNFEGNKRSNPNVDNNLESIKEYFYNP